MNDAMKRFCRRGGPVVAALALAAGAALGAPATVATAATSSPALSSPALWPSGVSPTGVSLAAATSGNDNTWAGYHVYASRTGAIPADSSINPTKHAWSVNLGGAVFGQPVAASGRVFAATETNRVVALDPKTGHVLWSTSIGAPLTNVQKVAGCGDIDPLGVTSTPVVDTVHKVVYVVGEVNANGAVQHRLVGLSESSGHVVLERQVDPRLPSGEHAAQLLQRAGLALSGGSVYVAFGGNAGDCGSYHGWLVNAPTIGTHPTSSFEVASDGYGGAIWLSGGAPAIDAHGNVYVTTGNANPDPPQGGPDPKAYTESVVELTSALKPIASFKDRIAGGDEDLATGNPVLLPDGDVFAIGKTDVAYVLKQGTLAQVAALSGVCGSDPDGGPAFDAQTDTMYVPCRGGGIQPVNLATSKVEPKLSGANGAPILVGSALWAAQYPTGTLAGFDTATGKETRSIIVGSTVPHFVSPSASLGHVFLGTDHGVAAFH